MLDKIITRRSIRKFTTDDIEEQELDQIIEMGTWAPSGLNNQPWKFITIRNKELKKAISLQTRYHHIINNAPVCIAVFLDNSLGYDRIKDLQAMGACIQNMLLTIHDMGLGGVWLGEILKNREAVERALEVPDGYELMAVIALGHPAESKGPGKRKELKEVIIGRR